MKFLLDTNVCIRLMRGDEVVRENLQQTTPDDCAVSMVTVFELFAGVERCADPEKESIKVKRLLSELHLLPFDWDSALRSAGSSKNPAKPSDPTDSSFSHEKPLPGEGKRR